jgi:predicted ester cyclase
MAERDAGTQPTGAVPVTLLPAGSSYTTGDDEGSEGDIVPGLVGRRSLARYRLHAMVGMGAMGQAEGAGARINDAQTFALRREESLVAMDTVTQGTDLDGKNVSAVRRLLEALTTGDVVALEEFISPDYIDHETPGVDHGGSAHGYAQFRESVGWLHRVFADVEFEEQEIISVDDRVVVRGVMRARQVGWLLGIAPAGQQVEVHQVHIFRLAGHKVAGHRAVWAEFSLLLQLGAVPRR